MKDNRGLGLEALHREVETRLLQKFGGFTGYKVCGSWLDGMGKRYDDESIKYEVYYHEKSQQRGDLRDIADFIMDGTDQKCIALCFATAPELLEKLETKFTEAQILERGRLVTEMRELAEAISRYSGSTSTIIANSLREAKAKLQAQYNAIKPTRPERR